MLEYTRDTNEEQHKRLCYRKQGEILIIKLRRKKERQDLKNQRELQTYVRSDIDKRKLQTDVQSRCENKGEVQTKVRSGIRENCRLMSGVGKGKEKEKGRD